MAEEFLKNVYGYEEIKNELKIIRDWYLNVDKNDEVSKALPKGVLFYGVPGSGKTHLMREYSKTFGYPIFIIEGNDDNVLDEVVKTYENASKEKNAIVIIDEIDKLVEKDSKLSRILMAKLDGYEISKVLTLATCNLYDDLPEALVRPGRFDRHFKLLVKSKKDLKEIIIKFLNEYKIDLSESDITELMQIFNNDPVCFIKSALSNASLRFGNKCTIDNIIYTIDFFNTGYFKKANPEIINKSAVHEAGHALYIYLFCKTQRFLRIYFNEDGGNTVFSYTREYITKESRIEQIRGALAGLIAEEIVSKYHDVGCSDDIEKAYNLSYRLVNRTCINGINNFCTSNNYFNKDNLSEYSKKDFERKAIKFLKKNYKLVKRQMKKYKNTIIKVSNYLIKNEGIKREEFIKIIEK